jgi:putative hydrolase of the HAD superfamily
LIFDFGNVVAHFDYREACATIGRRLGMPGDALLDRLRAGGLLPLAQRYERGQIDSETFSRSVGSLIDREIPHDEFAAAWSDIFWLNRPVADLIPFLKGRGYTLVLGSNTNDLHATQFRRQFADTLAHFDRLVLSYEIGHLKPSAPFYHACAEAAGAPPAGCVFIDDLPENVEGARSAGLSGLVYRDFPGLIDALRELGVEVPSGPI